jgi:predicted PhzF superfamily epimerase YddE/YHI9
VRAAPESEIPALVFSCFHVTQRQQQRSHLGTLAIEVDKHIEPDCSIICVRQQREKDVNALKPDLKTEAGLRDIDPHPDASESCVTSSAAGRLAFYFRPLKERCLIRETSTCGQEHHRSLREDAGKDKGTADVGGEDGTWIQAA